LIGALLMVDAVELLCDSSGIPSSSSSSFHATAAPGGERVDAAVEAGEDRPDGDDDGGPHCDDEEE
jgi:hypothetical protein